MPATANKTKLQTLFTVDRNALLSAVKPCAEILSAATGILSHVLISVTGTTTGQLVTVTGTDTENWRMQSVNIEMLVPSESKLQSFTVPGSRLVSILSALPNGLVDFIVDAKQDGTQKITIRSNRTDFTVESLNPGEYPAAPEVSINSETLLDVHAQDLGKALKSVVWAVAPPKSGHVAMEGVLIEVRRGGDNSIARVVGCFTPGMSYTDVNALIGTMNSNDGGNGNERWIVPANAVKHIIRIAEQSISDEDVTISCSGEHRNTIRVIRGTGELVCRLIESIYPDYERVLSTVKNTGSFSCETDMLAASIKRADAATSSNPGLEWARLFLTLSENVLTLERHGNGSNAGFSETLDVMSDALKGALETAINIRNLSAAVATFDGSQSINIAYSEPLKPILITDPDNPSHIVLTMPMQRN